MSRLPFLVLLLHAYIAVRLAPPLPTVEATGVVAWLVASAILMPLGWSMRRRRRSAHGPDVLAWSSMLALGAFSSLLVLTLLRDVILLLMTLVRPWLPVALLPAAIADSAQAVVCVAIAATLLGLYNARRRAAVRRIDVPIAALPAALHGFTIAQISDVHVGPTIRRRYVDAIVDAVNELHADLIAVTGDLVDGSVADLAEHTRPLARLSARHGAYFVTGNHEYYSGVRGWVAELERLGLIVLMNEHVLIEHGGARMVVGGVPDYSAHHYEPAQRSDPRAAIAGAPDDAAVRVLLAHQPRSAPAASAAGFDLQLSGHTHGGQFLPWNFFVRLQQPFTAGLHRLGSLWVYISRGTGYWGPPLRLGAPSEITALRLVPA
jgi:predicted MPP superfamily phosphohydrolase